MPLLKTVETVARTAVGTAVHVARHPLGTAANVTGFAKGVVGAGVGLVHGDASSGSSAPTQRESAPASRSADTEAPSTEDATSTDEPTAAPQPAIPDEPKIPGPDIVLKPVPTADELPEPIVIYADDDPAPETGEAFQTEPKATTRAESTGGAVGDLYEAEDEAEEALEDLTGPHT